MYVHFLQSPSWEAFQTALKKTTFQKSTSDFSYLATLETTSLGNYLYCPYGPALNEKTPKSSLKSALDSLTSLAREHNCFFIRLEPVTAFDPAYLSSLGLKKSKDLNPADTWVLDLAPDEKALLSGFSQGTRTRHNQFARKGLSVSVSKDPADIKFLVSLQKKLAEEKHINTFSEDYLKTELSMPFSSLYLVHYQDPETSTEKIISASLFFDDEKNQTRFYMQSATDSTYKKLPATVGLLTSAIFDAKAKGLKYFDFWGIAPEDAPESHPWAGFTAFKKSFGGFAKSYSGTFDLPLSSKYHLYTLLRKINLRLRHF